MRTLPDLSPVTRYIELKALISEATEELETLKPELLEALCQEPGEKFAYQGFEFSLQRRKNWIYSESVQNQLSDLEAEIKHFRAEIKDLQVHAQTHALAEVESYTPILVMKTIKD